MNKVLCFAILCFFSLHNVNALSLKGSPDRCEKKKDDWAYIDDLLPPRSENGGYAHPSAEMAQKIEKVTPELMLQSVVDHVLTYLDLCGVRVAGVGGWTEDIGTNLCERMALYNITHDGILSDESSPTTQKKTLFAADDLAFLKSVFKACRPSTARWWNYPLIVHVSFSPTHQEYDHFKKLFESQFSKERTLDKN